MRWNESNLRADLVVVRKPRRGRVESDENPNDAGPDPNRLPTMIGARRSTSVRQAAQAVMAESIMECGHRRKPAPSMASTRRA